MDEKLKRAQSLVGTSEGRPADDLYCTPPEAVEALLKVEKFDGNIWEPAAGFGHISEVLKRHGYEVVSTDLVDRGYGEGNHDFLTSTLTADNVITNPPFTLSEKFVELSLKRTKYKVAILGKLQFLEGAKRKIMFENTPFKVCHVFSKRIKMARNNNLEQYSSSMMAFAWFVWDHKHSGAPSINWI